MTKLLDKKNTLDIKILIAEDEYINRTLIKLQLENNYSLDFAENGIEAVKKAREQVYDLIIMDIKMPYKDGVSATKDIREFSSIPIFAYTAYINDEEELKKAGMNEFLTKPLNINKLHALITTYIHK